MADPIVSRPFSHSTGCPRCVFSQGEHSEFCPLYRCSCNMPLGLHMSGERHADECPLSARYAAHREHVRTVLENRNV
jgi:hypothetical protein